MRKPLGKSLLYSFIAMALGWIACNSFFWITNLKMLLNSHETPWDELTSFARFSLYPGAVILAAWILVFFPTFYFIPTRSRLWKPLPASLLGIVLGYLTAYFFYIIIGIWFFDQRISIMLLLKCWNHHDLLPIYCGAIVTGLTAALFSALIKNRVKEISLS